LDPDFFPLLTPHRSPPSDPTLPPRSIPRRLEIREIRWSTERDVRLDRRLQTGFR